MATIVNTPAPAERSDSGAGWAVAVIILLAVIIGGYFAFAHYRGGSAAPAGGTANINVTLPGTSGAGSAAGSGSTGGTAAGGGNTSAPSTP